MGKMKRANEDIWERDRVKDAFYKFLAKTGNQAAYQHIHGLNLGGLTESHVLDAMRYAIGNFGAPDNLMISPDALAAFQKLNGGNK